MAQSISVEQKKRGRGRPATGHDPAIGVRMPLDERQAVEEWAAKQPDKPTFSKAVRHLVKLGLAAAPKRAKRKETHE